MEFPIADLLDDGINGDYEMADADGNSVGTVSVNINFESGDGTFLMFSSRTGPVIEFLCFLTHQFSDTDF